MIERPNSPSIPSIYSDRVAEFAAACVQALAKRRLGIVIPEASARKLALIYGNVGTAIRALALAKEVHRAIGAGTLVDSLAIAESELISSVLHEDTVNAVIKIRKEMYKSRRRGSRTVEEARKIDLRQDSFKREMRDWSEGFKTLLDSLDSLFEKTEHRLHLLGLAPEDLADAIAEAEDILSRAIKRAFEDS